MKRMMKKILSFALIVALLGAVAFVPLSDAVTSAATQPSAPTVFTTYNQYNYRLQECFDRSPDTVMAWVRMDRASAGGTIMSNNSNSDWTSDGTAEWSVDALGRVGVMWNKGKFTHTFAHASIADGAWHHVTVTRDEQGFTLYLDGEIADAVKCAQPALDAAVLPMNIGVCYSVSYTPSDRHVKRGFEGDIREITVYHGAVTQERVKADMAQNAPKDDYDGALMGSWYLGEQWTEATVAESTGMSNSASIVTFDRYVADATKNYEYDYGFVVIPDIQTCVRRQPEAWDTMTTWLRENTERMKLKFALQVGDLSDVGNDLSLYQQAAAGLDKLNNILPYSFAQGNHDYDNSCHEYRLTSNFDETFPYSKHRWLAGFGDVYEEGTMQNSYYLHEIGGIKYCVINLEVSPRTEVLRWAGKVCEMYPDHRIIFNTHAYLDHAGNLLSEYSSSSPSTYKWRNTTDVSTSQEMYDQLFSRYQNVFMVFCGHVGSDDIKVRTDVGVYGNNITSMLVDAQASVADKGLGEDAILICKVNEKTKKMCCVFYSPTNDGVYNLQNQFEISFADAGNPTVGA